jgi:hypothetical protein
MTNEFEEMELTAEYDHEAHKEGYWHGVSGAVSRELDYDNYVLRRTYKLGYEYGSECLKSGRVK